MKTRIKRIWTTVKRVPRREQPLTGIIPHPTTGKGEVRVGGVKVGEQG